MTDQQLIKPMTNVIRLVPIVVFILVCFRPEAKPAELVFAYWGSPFERKAVEKESKNSTNSIPTSEYVPNIFRIQIIRPS